MKKIELRQLIKEEIQSILNEEQSLQKDILDFWNTIQDDASQSDGEYKAKWDTEFFIEIHPEYEGKEKEIENIVSRYIKSKNQTKPKGIKGTGSVLDFVKKNINDIVDKLEKDGLNKIQANILRTNPKLISGNEDLVQVKFIDKDNKLYNAFQIAFNRNKITDGGYKSKMIINGVNLFTTD
jgi:ABC-type transport system substrate-binding protein